MQLVKFDSEEVEARRRQLNEYAFQIAGSVKELDSELQSLIFQNKKVISELCYSSPVRSDDDGAFGKIKFVIQQMSKDIEHLNKTLARVQKTLNYWESIKSKLEADINNLNSRIAFLRVEINSVDSRLKSLPEPKEEAYTVTDENGVEHTEYITVDPYASERAKLRDKLNSLWKKLDLLNKELEGLQSKFNIAERNCEIASDDINKLNSFVSRAVSIRGIAKKDDIHIKNTLNTLNEITGALNKYRSILASFKSAVSDLLEKAKKIFGKALSAINKLKSISNKNIIDFRICEPMKVTFDIDECKRYYRNGVEFNEELESLYRFLAVHTANLVGWNDKNRSEATRYVANHTESMNRLVNFYDEKMDFLKTQIEILTEYYTAAE